MFLYFLVFGFFGLCLLVLPGMKLLLCPGQDMGIKQASKHTNNTSHKTQPVVVCQILRFFTVFLHLPQLTESLSHCLQDSLQGVYLCLQKWSRKREYMASNSRTRSQDSLLLKCFRNNFFPERFLIFQKAEKNTIDGVSHGQLSTPAPPPAHFLGRD